MQEVSQQQFGIVGNEVELSVEHIMQMKVYLRHCFEYIDVCNTVLLPGQGNMVFYPRMASYQCKASVLSATGIMSMVDGKEFHAHQNILGLNSPVLCVFLIPSVKYCIP